MKVNFRQNISTFSLTMTGVTAIVGSGWLLGTQKIAELAGPAGILSWLFGALIALVVGLFYVEIGSAFPSAGGIGYYSNITHGRFCGFLTSWINWLSISAVPPIEAQSVIQYLSQINSHFMMLYNVQTHNLTALGISTAIVLMFLFMFINYWSVQLFIRFNDIFTIIKVAVPILTIICLIYNGLHSANFGTNVQEFMPYGFKSIFITIVTCGVVMSFNGFQSPLNFSEEIKNPKRMLPIAITASILFTLILYVLLQVVFIGSLSPNLIAQGWASVNFRSPYIELLLLANMQLMVTVIYIGAVVSPGVCGAAFVASSSRIMYSLSQQKQLPAFLSRLHPVHHNPRNAIIVTTLVGFIYLFIFKGWYTLVAVISVLHIFSYVAAPIVTIANRTKNKQVMAAKDQFKLKGAYILAPILLFILSILLFYAAWPLTGEMLVFILPGLLFYFYYDFKYNPHEKFTKSIKGASWLIFYIIAISLIAYLGNNPKHGNMISTDTSMILLAILAGITYIYGAFYAPQKKSEEALENY